MLNQFKFNRLKPTPATALFWLLALLALASLACSLGGLFGTEEPSKAVRIKKVLPLFTPTPAAPVESSNNLPANDSNASQAVSSEATPTPTPLPTLVSVAALVVDEAPPVVHYSSSSRTTSVSDSVPDSAPSSSSSSNSGQAPTSPFSSKPNPNPAPTSPSSSNPNPDPSPTAPPSSNPDPISTTPPPSDPLPPPPVAQFPPGVDGWSFIGARTSIDETEATVVGELVNNTGLPQTAVHISGVLYDEQSQVIVDGVETLSYVPVDVIPAGAHVPFELAVESDEAIYRLDLYAMSEPAGNPPRQDFQISSISPWTDSANMYCLGGQIQNPGAPLEDYLIIVAFTYNEQGQLVSFGEYSLTSPEQAVGDQTSSFELCIDPMDQTIVSHELAALGF